jgi:hypothetical protein
LSPAAPPFENFDVAVPVAVEVLGRQVLGTSIRGFRIGHAEGLNGRRIVSAIDSDLSDCVLGTTLGDESVRGKPRVDRKRELMLTAYVLDSAAEISGMRAARQ